MTNVATQMAFAADVVAKLEAQGFEVQRISVDCSRLIVIRLFRNSKCEEMIKNGGATIQYCGHKQPIRQGFFYQDDCRVVWSESLH